VVLKDRVADLGDLAEECKVWVVSKAYAVITSNKVQDVGISIKVIRWILDLDTVGVEEFKGVVVVSKASFKADKVGNFKGNFKAGKANFKADKDNSKDPEGGISRDKEGVGDFLVRD